VSAFKPAISPLRLRQAGAVLFCLYLAAGAIFSFALAPQARYVDEWEYLVLSDHVRHGQGYSMDGVHLTACRPPGYVFFMAAIQATGGGIVAIRLVQYLLVGVTILLICRLCAKDQDFAGALPIVTGLVMIYPVLFYTSATLYPQTVAGFLFVLAMSLLVMAPRGLVLNLTTGLTFGALMLTVPTFALTVVVTLAVAGGLRMIRVRDAVLILVGAALLIAPWAARNAVVFHRFVPFSSNSGANLLIGNCENTIPYGGAGNIDLTHYEQETRRLGLDEFEADRYYRQAALSWIAQHPARAVVLYFEKAANFFNVYNAYAPENKAEVSVWKQVVLAVSYGALLALLAWRLLETKRFPLTSREKLFLAVYVLSAFTSAVFVTRIRYRLPYDYLIITVIALHLLRRLDGGWNRNSFPATSKQAAVPGD